MEFVRGYYHDACFAGAHGGAPLADFIQMSAFDGWICLSCKAGEESHYLEILKVDSDLLKVKMLPAGVVAAYYGEKN